MPVTITVSDSTRDAIRPKRPPRKKGETEEEYWDRLGRMHGPDRGEVDEGLDITDEEYEEYARDVPEGDDEPQRDERPQRRIGSKGLEVPDWMDDEKERRKRGGPAVLYEDIIRRARKKHGFVDSKMDSVDSGNRRRGR